MNVLMQRARRVTQPTYSSKERRGEPNLTLEYLGEPVYIAVGEEVDVSGLEGLKFVYYQTHDTSSLSAYLHTAEGGGNFASLTGLNDEPAEFIKGPRETVGAHLDDIYYEPLILWRRDNNQVDINARPPEYITTIRVEKPPSLIHRGMQMAGKIFSRAAA